MYGRWAAELHFVRGWVWTSRTWFLFSSPNLTAFYKPPKDFTSKVGLKVEFHSKRSRKSFVLTIARSELSVEYRWWEIPARIPRVVCMCVFFNCGLPVGCPSSQNLLTFFSWSRQKISVLALLAERMRTRPNKTGLDNLKRSTASSHLK